MVQTTEALDHEWNTDYAHTEPGSLALERWADEHPELEGMCDLECVLTARRDPARSDGIMTALGCLASIDPLAARTLFQAMLPGLVDLALRRFSDHPDAVEEIMPIAWTRVSTYPASRPGSVPGNILLDVTKRYLQSRDAIAPDFELLTVDPGSEMTAPSAEEVVMNSSMLLDIERAARRGVITERAFDVIVRTRVHEVGLDEIAAEMGTTARYEQCVRRRAELKLRDRLPAVA